MIGRGRVAPAFYVWNVINMHKITIPVLCECDLVPKDDKPSMNQRERCAHEVNMLLYASELL